VALSGLVLRGRRAGPLLRLARGHGLSPAVEQDFLAVHAEVLTPHFQAGLLHLFRVNRTAPVVDRRREDAGTDLLTDRGDLVVDPFAGS
jgi:hypothetical protein